MTHLENYASNLRFDFTIPEAKHDRFHDLDKIMGYLSRKEAEALYVLAKDAPGEGAVVEIGSYAGRSASYIAEGLRDGKREQVVFCVDPYEDSLGFEEFQTQKRFIIDADLLKDPNNTLWELFHFNLDRVGLSEYTIPVRALSVDFAKQWSAPIRLLFIDGEHNYINVYKDVEAWTPFLQDGALICLHDVTYWALYLSTKGMMHADGVARYVETELLDHPNFEFVHKADSLVIFQYSKTPSNTHQHPDRISDPVTFCMPFFPPRYWRFGTDDMSTERGVVELNGWYGDDVTEMHLQTGGVCLQTAPGAEAEVNSFYRPIDTVIGEIYEATVTVQTNQADHMTMIETFGVQDWMFNLSDSPTLCMTEDRFLKRNIIQGSGVLKVQFRTFCRRSWIKISTGGYAPDSTATLSNFSLKRIPKGTNHHPPIKT